jgi:hypothetical protein
MGPSIVRSPRGNMVMFRGGKGRLCAAFAFRVVLDDQDVGFRWLHERKFSYPPHYTRGRGGGNIPLAPRGR